MSRTNSHDNPVPLANDSTQSLHVSRKITNALNPPVDFSEFHLLHEVFRHRAADLHQGPLLAFPQQRHDDFEYFTGKDLDRYVDCAAWVYEGKSLRTVSDDECLTSTSTVRAA